MMASAALETVLRSMSDRPTLMLPAGRCALAPVRGPPDEFFLADGEAGEEERRRCPALALPACAAGRFACRPKPPRGFALNVVSTMPATMARTRHPAMSGTIIPLWRSGVRQRLLRS